MLPRLLSRVTRSPAVAFTADDLYRICALAKSPQDILGLRQHDEFLHQLAQQYQQLKASDVSPFQKSLLDDVLLPLVAQQAAAPTPCSDAGSYASTSSALPPSTASSSPPPVAAGQAQPPATPGQPAALECLTAIWSLIDEAAAEKSDVGGDRLTAIEAYMKELERQLRQLTPTETASLVKALATIHYRNYQQTALLARRSCEVAAQLTHQDACQLYFNLTRLQSMDSLMPLVRRIIEFEGELSVKEVHQVAQSIERQSNTSFAGGKLLGAVIQRGAVVAKNAKSPSFHRSLLSAAARYNFTRNTSLQGILDDLARFKKDAFQLKDVTALLRAMTALAIPATHPVYGRLVHCVKEGVSTTMDVRLMDSVMDILSEVPVDTTLAMKAMMARLEKDAGKLTIPQLMNILQLLSSYPPAKGHVCIVSLSFAAALRSESIELSVMEEILVSLAQLGHFTDDFFNLVRTFFQKGGFRKFDTLHAVLSECPPAVLQSPEGEELVRSGILQLAPVLNDQELQLCRTLLTEKGINDKTLHQRVLSRAKQLQRGAGGGMASQRGGRGRGNGGRRRHYDPMDDLIQ